MMEKEEYNEIKCRYIESVVIIIWLEKSRRKYNAPNRVLSHGLTVRKFR